MAKLNRTQLRRREEEKALLAVHTFITAALGIFCLYFFVTNASSKRGKKRTRMGGEKSSIEESMKNWMNITLGYMRDIAKSIGYSKELSARRQNVPVELEKLDLTMIEKFKVGAIICQAEERVDIFYGIPDEQKQAWVEAALEGNIYGQSNN